MTRDLTRRKGHTTRYATHALGPTAAAGAIAVAEDPDPAHVAASAGPYPWRAGWRIHDPERPCWTCGAAPRGVAAGGGPAYPAGSHSWYHQAPLTVDAAAGEWIDYDWQPPRRDY